MQQEQKKDIYDYDDEPVLQEIDYNQLMLDLTSKVPQMMNYLESENDKQFENSG